MPSLDRAFGARGAIVALCAALVVGLVHGVLAWQFDHLAAKIAVGTAGAVVLLMAGIVAARRSPGSVLGLALIMGAAFFLARWTGWSVMDGGTVRVAEFIAAAPPGWPGWLAAHGISPLWPVEAASMFAPALYGCYVGQQRDTA